ncbi:MAG: hypothetical protein HOI09_00145 [Porticoccaceae bacterium]|jgi:hypothetical protein|nr:hypothetical protein [Porticoccaceae bacterium]|tara:strand:- start:467 stop:721 length:255 start_codon:yes stop_codon:yes gene_type:complete
MYSWWLDNETIRPYQFALYRAAERAFSNPAKEFGCRYWRDSFALLSIEFLGAFPLGKLPLLLLDDKSTIAESTVIMVYFEALFP